MISPAYSMLGRAVQTALFAALTSSTLLAAPVTTIRVDDSFSDGGISNGTDALDIAWAKLSYGDTLALGAGPFNTSGNTSNSLVFNSNYTTAGAFPYAKGGIFPSQVLNVVGDSITLAFDFRITSTTIPSNTAALRFALGSNSQTYAFTFGSGTAPSRGLGVYGYEIVSGTSTALTTSGNPIAINDRNAHTFTLKLTRTAPNVLSVQATVDGNTFTGTHTGVTNFLFNRIIIGEGGVNNLDFNVDNVQVSTSLEPWARVLPAMPSNAIPSNLGANTGVVSQQLTTADFQKLVAAKIKYIRVDLTWTGVEYTKGQYTWTYWDQLAAKAEENGLNIIWILCYNHPAYEANGGGIETEAARIGFANYAKAAVQRYDKPGAIWELWNEQNSDFWQPDHNPDNYMLLLDKVVTEVKSVRPNCIFISGGVIDIAWAQTTNWLDRCFQLGLLNKVDGIGVHLYGGAANRNVERIPAEIENLRNTFVTYGAPVDFPIFETEFGTDVSEYNGDYVQQAQTCARSYLIHQMCGLKLDVWYEWRRPGTSGMALLNSDGTSRPAYNALNVLTSQLNGYTFERRETLASPGDYALVFKNGSQRKLAVWTSSWTPHTAAIPVATSATSLPLVSMTGTTGSINVVGGTVSPNLSQAVQYIDLGTGGPAGPATIIHDPFTDGGLTNGADTADTAWYSMASTALLSVGAFNTSGNTTSSLVCNNTRSGATGPYPYFKGGSFSIPALAVGKSVELTFDFRLTAALPNSGSALRFGLGSGSNTYALLFGTGTTSGGALHRYNADIVSGTSTPLTTTGTPVAVNNTTPHTFRLTLTRGSTALSVSAAVDGNTFTATDTGISNFTFDRVLIGQGGVDNVDMTIDNVKVETY